MSKRAFTAGLRTSAVAVCCCLREVHQTVEGEDPKAGVAPPQGRS